MPVSWNHAAFPGFWERKAWKKRHTALKSMFELNLIFGKTPLFFLIVFFPETCADRVALKLINSEWILVKSTQSHTYSNVH